MKDYRTRRAYRVFGLVTVFVLGVTLLQRRLYPGTELQGLTREYVLLTKKALRTLAPSGIGAPRKHFRHILVRESVGLQWNFYPEQYFSDGMLPRLTPNSVIIDVGANVGQFAIPIVKRGHRVISFEPNKQSCDTLKRGVDQYSGDQIEIHCSAAGDESGQVTFALKGASTSFVQVENSNKNTSSLVTVYVERLDDVLANQDVFLLKTDTQGYELNVLKGAARLLRDGCVRFMLVEFSYGLMQHSKTDPFALLNFIYDHSFVCTYMAYHTLLKDRTSYGMVKQYPNFHQDAVSFEEFIASLEHVSTSSTAGVSGWTDLLCWHNS